MTRTALRVAAAGAVAATVLLCAGAAQAAANARVFGIENTEGQVSFVFQGTGLPQGASIDPASVRANVGDVTLATTAKPIATTGTPVVRTAVLAIDTSASMKTDDRIGAAKAAAHSFLDKLPPDVQVALVTFGADITAQPATSNHAAVGKAVDALTTDTQSSTRLYDGVALAVATAGDEGPRSILLLTDGKSYKSQATLADAVSTVKTSQATLDAFYIGPQPTPTELQTIVNGGKGTVFEGDPSTLAVAFQQAASDINSQLQVTATVPAELADKQATITVTGQAGSVTLSATALTVFGAKAPPPVDYGPKAVTQSKLTKLVTDSTLPIAIAVMFVGLLIILAVAFTSVTRSEGKSGRVRRRLSIYTLTGRAPIKQQETSTVLGSSQVARSAVELAGKVVQQRDFEGALAQRLEAGGVPLRPAEWMLIHIGVALGLAFLLLFLSGGAIIPTVLGLGLGLALPWIYLSLKESRRTSAFLGQLPDTLQLIAGSLSAGYSMPQAMDTVVREGQQPITGEFNRALVEARLGVPVEDALEGVAGRMHSKDFEWVVMAIRIQREVGGNLAELLNTVSGTLRERERLRRQVKVLSAEGRLSAWILGLLPIVFATYLLLVRPEYLQPLVSETLGWLLLSVGVVLLTVGALWMRKAVKVEV